ncbi:villin-4-like protein isoform X1, partial [Tanacetum coccineum]
YLYPGEDQEECLIGTWFGSLSIEEDRISATSQAYKMIELQKFLAARVNRVFMKEVSLPVSSPSSRALWFLRYARGLNDGYKNILSEKERLVGTCTEEEVALFRVQGSGPENMQAIQLEPVGLLFLQNSHQKEMFTYRQCQNLVQEMEEEFNRFQPGLTGRRIAEDMRS